MGNKTSVHVQSKSKLFKGVIKTILLSLMKKENPQNQTAAVIEPDQLVCICVGFSDFNKTTQINFQ